MRVLVTGGLGFTGRVVADRLARHGHDVVALTSRTAPRGPDGWEPPPPSGVALMQADLRDAEAVADVVADGDGFDAVCHLAARTKVRESLSDPIGYFEVNLAGTLHVLAALEALKAPTGARRIPRLVFASTAAVYGNREGRFAEGEPTAPATPYATSKLAAEKLIGYQAQTGRLAAVSLRCVNIAGAVGRPDLDLTRIIPKALAVAAGLHERLQINGDGGTTREYTHVTDVAQAYLLALTVARPCEHRVYNVGSGYGATVLEVLDTVRRITGRPVPVEHLPARPEPRLVVTDSSRIRTELGWRPCRSNLDELVRDGWLALLEAIQHGTAAVG